LKSVLVPDAASLAARSTPIGSKLKSTLDQSFAEVNLSQAQLLVLDARNNLDAALAQLNSILGLETTVQHDTGQVVLFQPRLAMREVCIEHLIAGTRRAFARYLLEMSKIRELFSKREGAVRDALLDPRELLPGSPQVRFARNDR